MQPSTAHAGICRAAPTILSNKAKGRKKPMCASICKNIHAALPYTSNSSPSFADKPNTCTAQETSGSYTTHGKKKKEETRASLFHVIIIIASYVVELLAKGQLQLHILIGYTCRCFFY